MKIIKVLTVMMMLLSSYMYAKDFVLNIQDQTNKDPIKVSILLEIDDKGKIIPFQRLKPKVLTQVQFDKSESL